MSEEGAKLSATQKLVKEKPATKQAKTREQFDQEHEFKLPKYTNLSESEKLWVMAQKEKHGDEKAERAYKQYTNSIDNSNTQFVRYLHQRGQETDQNLFCIEAGEKKENDIEITVEEAKKFNEGLPDFFSPEYEAQQHRRFKEHVSLGFLSSGIFLALTVKTYQVRFAEGMRVMNPTLGILGIGLMMGAGMRMAQRANQTEQKRLEKYGIRLIEYHPKLYNQF